MSALNLNHTIAVQKKILLNGDSIQGAVVTCVKLQSIPTYSHGAYFYDPK